jgi:cytochrome c-type biogenesis protein CcmH/NrfG
MVVVPRAATTWARTEEYGSGLTLAQSLVARRPTPVARHILGEQLLLAGQMEPGITELRLSAAGGNTRARYQLGMALLEQKRNDEAAETLEAFVATAGKPQQQRWLEPPVIDVLNARVALAELQAAAGRWSAVEAHARAVLTVAPAHRDARRALSLALFRQERWPEAVESYRLQLERDPSEVPAWMNLGVALVASERIDDAVEAFRRAATLDPSNPNAKRLLNMALDDAARF